MEGKMMGYAVGFAFVYIAVLGWYFHSGIVARLGEKLTHAHRTIFGMSRQLRELTGQLELIHGELRTLIERDAKSFSGVTNRLDYNVEITPDMASDFTRIRAEIPVLHFQLSGLEIVHHRSLEMMAKNVSMRLADLSYETVLDFFTTKMKFRKVI